MFNIFRAAYLLTVDSEFKNKDKNEMTLANSVLEIFFSSHNDLHASKIINSDDF